MPNRPHTYILNPRTNMLTDIDVGKSIPLHGCHKSRPVVAVDPGHGVMKRMRWGGSIYDIGCDTVTGATESVITKHMALELARELNEKGIDAIITHDSSRQNAGDGFDFRNRTAKVADAFIALHVDSAANKKAHGSRIYSHSAHAPGDKLRERIAEHNKGDHLHDTRARRENHDVTRPLHVGDTPAILVELGFGTNIEDSKNLNSAYWRKQTARELAKDIDTFLTSPATQKARTQSPAREAQQIREEQTDDRPIRRSNAHAGMHMLHHDITSGDTYRQLSKEYFVSVEDLQKVNKPRVPIVGQEVIIPHVRSFTVGNDDTFFSIATQIADTDGKGGINTREVIELMRKLNPELKDIAHIKPDGELVVPRDASAVLHMQQQIRERTSRK